MATGQYVLRNQYLRLVGDAVGDAVGDTVGDVADGAYGCDESNNHSKKRPSELTSRHVQDQARWH